MTADILNDYYERDSARFWDPRKGFTGRDLDIVPLLAGRGGALLEYGCGSGSLLLNLATEDRFSYCHGVDISKCALGKIESAWESMKGARDFGQLTVSQPVNDRLPSISRDTFDVIISVATIEHVLDPYIVLDELHRVATKGAIFICSVPNYAYLKHRIQLLFGVQPRTGTDRPVEEWRTEGWDGMHLHTFTKSSFATLLRTCGWNPQRWSGAGTRFGSLGFTHMRRRFPGLLSGELIVACSKR